MFIYIILPCIIVAVLIIISSAFSKTPAYARNIRGDGIHVDNTDIKSAVASLNKEKKTLDIYCFSNDRSEAQLRKFSHAKIKNVGKAIVVIEVTYTDDSFSEIKNYEININSKREWERRLRYSVVVYLKARMAKNDPDATIEISSPLDLQTLSIKAKGSKKVDVKGRKADLSISWDIAQSQVIVEKTLIAQQLPDGFGIT